MVRAPCCSKVGLMRGPWSAKEDALLTNYIQQHGEGQWRSLPKQAGLLRCGKSCRLRWMNYLRPGIKRGNISEDEEDLIVRLHGLLGNRWSLIAGRLPGRTDNEIKNYWNTYLLKKLQNAGINPNPHKDLPKPTKKSSKNTTDDHRNFDNNPKKKKKKVLNNNNKNKSSMKEGGVVIVNDDTNLGKVNDGDETRDDNITKVKVYLPKAMRVSSVMPRTDSLDSLASGGGPASSGSTAVEAAEMTWQPAVFEIGNAADNYYAGGVCGGDDDTDFLLPLLRSCGSGDDVDMLDMVYDESIFSFLREM